MCDEPIVECVYGWGQVFRLYHDHLETQGISYFLRDLLLLRPTYHRFMGVDSALLFLRFKKRTLVLRGIAAIEDVRRAVAYLETHCATAMVDQHEGARRFQEETLPHVPVPLRLLPGEHAHYTTAATLCEDPLSESTRYVYSVKDQGTLILTNRRMIYVGRKSQLVLDYGRLLHVSHLQDAVAFHAEHWPGRELFEMRRPLECVLYVEAILRRFQRDMESDSVFHWQSYHQVI